MMFESECVKLLPGVNIAGLTCVADHEEEEMEAIIRNTSNSILRFSAAHFCDIVLAGI